MHIYQMLLQFRIIQIDLLLTAIWVKILFACIRISEFVNEWIIIIQSNQWFLKCWVFTH